LQWGLPRRDLGHGDVFAGEDGVEGGGELRVPVADEMGEVGGAVAEVPQELAGLLGGPGWVGRAVTPRMWTVRVRTSMKNRAYSRCSPTVSAWNRSVASRP
jgi:hypothetical protein